MDNSDHTPEAIMGLLKEKALEHGASEAEIISPAVIPIQDEIIEMCKPPRCEGYGKSIHCPPNAMKPPASREWVQRFQRALLFKIDTSPKVLLSEEGLEVFRKIYRIASKLEKQAMDEGYPSSKGLAAGSCKAVFCRDKPCKALDDKDTCRFPALARPSMEALGINVFELVKKVGWEIHAMGRDSNPEEVPSAMLVGLVLVGQ